MKREEMLMKMVEMLMKREENQFERLQALAHSACKHCSLGSLYDQKELDLVQTFEAEEVEQQKQQKTVDWKIQN